MDDDAIRGWKEQGLGAFVLPGARRCQPGEGVSWVLPLPDDVAFGDLTWYTDASLMDAAHRVGLVAVDAKGNCCAAASAIPPGWVFSVTEAGAWAIWLVLHTVPTFRRIVTDSWCCVTGARLGYDVTTFTPAAYQRHHL